MRIGLVPAPGCCPQGGNLVFATDCRKWAVLKPGLCAGSCHGGRERERKDITKNAPRGPPHVSKMIVARRSRRELPADLR
jgi:hypothetical protein